MTIEHEAIIDGERHEPKGALGATAGHVLKANGGDSTSWVAADTLVDVGAVTLETILSAKSVATSQEPVGKDNPLKIEFGNAQNSGVDPVMLANDGTVTFNEAGTYLITLTFQYGRSGSASVAHLHARAVANGVAQAGDTVSASIDSASTLIPISVATWSVVAAGTTFHYEVVRDSLGANAGGLFSSVATLGDWTDSPCAHMDVERMIAL